MFTKSSILPLLLWPALLWAVSPTSRVLIEPPEKVVPQVSPNGQVSFIIDSKWDHGPHELLPKVTNPDEQKKLREKYNLLIDQAKKEHNLIEINLAADPD